MSEKIKAAVFNNDESGQMFNRVFGEGRREKLAEITDLYPVQITDRNFDEHVGKLQDVEVIFSTWNMLELTGEQIKKLPSLKAVFYAAGGTGYFREPFLKAGIKVCTSISANGIPVAEFALAQVLLAGAGYFRNSRECIDEDSSRMPTSYRGHGNYGKRVALLGNGTISNHLQGYLSHHDLEVVVVPSRAENRTVFLEEAFASSFAIVNLFPDRKDNARILDRHLFEQMIDSAVFINVGRGQQVNEEDLISVMKARPDLTALLDVQWPEPPLNGSELYALPNVQLSAHLAGSKAAELFRMADYMIEEFLRYERGDVLLYEVQLDQL